MKSSRHVGWSTSNISVKHSLIEWSPDKDFIYWLILFNNAFFIPFINNLSSIQLSTLQLYRHISSDKLNCMNAHTWWKINYFCERILWLLEASIGAKKKHFINKIDKYFITCQNIYFSNWLEVNVHRLRLCSLNIRWDLTCHNFTQQSIFK